MASRSRLELLNSTPAEPAVSSGEYVPLPLGLRIGVLGKRWTLIILGQILTDKDPSFSRLLHSHHRITRRVLSMRLRELQREGYIERTLCNRSSHRTAYTATAKGRAAMPFLRAFSELVKRYGEGVYIAPGSTVRTEDLCYEHPPFRASARTMVVTTPLPPDPMHPTRREVLMYKSRCEKCRAELTPDSEAYVCSYGCTWCRPCAEGFRWRCPNCQGGLRSRPRASYAVTVSRNRTALASS